MPSKRHSKGPRGAKAKGSGIEAKPSGDADALTLDNGGQSWKRDRISGELSCVRYRLLSVLRLLLRKKTNTEGWQKSFEEHYRHVDVETGKTEQLEYFWTPYFPAEYSLGLATMSAAWDRRIAVLAHRPAWYIKDIVSVIVAGPDVVTRLQRLHFDAPGPPFVSGEDGRLDFTYQFRTAAEAFLNEEVQAAVDAGDLRIPSRPADAAMWVQDLGFILPRRILDLFVGKRRIGTKKGENLSGTVTQTQLSADAIPSGHATQETISVVEAGLPQPPESTAARLEGYFGIGDLMKRFDIVQEYRSAFAKALTQWRHKNQLSATYTERDAPRKNTARFLYSAEAVKDVAVRYSRKG